MDDKTRALVATLRYRREDAAIEGVSPEDCARRALVGKDE